MAPRNGLRTKKSLPRRCAIKGSARARVITLEKTSKKACIYIYQTSTYLLVCRDIPDLNVAEMCADRDEVSPLVPGDGGDAVAVPGQVAQPGYLTRTRRPEVDAAAQPNAQHVLRRPVHEIQVEVVLQFGSVQHFERDPGDLSRGFSGRAQEFLALGAEGRERVGRALVEERSVLRRCRVLEEVPTRQRRQYSALLALAFHILYAST